MYRPLVEQVDGQVKTCSERGVDALDRVDLAAFQIRASIPEERPFVERDEQALQRARARFLLVLLAVHTPRPGTRIPLTYEQAADSDPGSQPRSAPTPRGAAGTNPGTAPSP